MSVFNHKPAHTCFFSRSRHSMKFPRFIHKPLWPAATRHSARCLRLQQTQPHWLRPASFPMETKIESVKKKQIIPLYFDTWISSHTRTACWTWIANKSQPQQWNNSYIYDICLLSFSPTGLPFDNTPLLNRPYPMFCVQLPRDASANEGNHFPLAKRN